ncbi:MAG: DsrE/DsrF/TusD sulfur relay family protein [Candidatus Heimdallarchaeota archaeon]
MSTYTFMISTEPYKFEAVDTLLNLCRAVLQKGHNIKGIFFYGSGVYNIKKDIETGITVRNLPARLEEFIKENQIPVAGCTTWIGLCGLNEHCFIDGAKEEGLGELSNWTAESDKLIMFGTGG